MASQLDMIQDAELSLVSCVSSASVEMARESTLAVTSGVSTGSVHVTGPTDTAIEAGPEYVSGFTAPTLDQWAISGVDSGLFATMTVIAPTETLGDPCTVRLKLVLGKDQAVFEWSTPDQNSPHAAECIVDNVTMRGELCDLYWKYLSAGHTIPYELVAAAAVAVPGPGDAPTESVG